ncbi:YtxH domain-containing protein [Fictibacillus iocasae]|uniref:YtxH domain-containing protein n=1 Tax=Fictibacillus iocasae TaxID=2715437 RepID=A0ABW2NZH7_9BACL
MGNNNQGIDSKDFIIGALVGGIVGAASALLLAPKTGKELRGDLNEQAILLKDKGNEFSQLAIEKSNSIVKTVSEQSNQVAGKVKELTTNIRRDIDKWREKGQVEQENEEIYGEITEQPEAEDLRTPELAEQKY